MANEISLVTASGRTVTPKDDGIIYEVFSPGDGIIYGGAVTIKDSSTLHITAGHGIVCGRKFTIDDSDIPVALSGSGSLLGRLYIHLDLADAADPITLLVETGESLTPVVQDADVNINNGVFEINIATFDVDTTTISNLVDVAPTVSRRGDTPESVGGGIIFSFTDDNGDHTGETITITKGTTVVTGEVGVGTTQVSFPETGTITVQVGSSYTRVVSLPYFKDVHFDLGTVNYGFKVSKATQNPSSRVEYLGDAVGLTPAKMNFSSGVFDYGDWAGAFFMPRPCMLKNDGTVDYYLDPDDYAKKADGTPSDITDSSYNGDVMVEFPKIFVKRTEDANYYYVYISDQKLDANYKCYANLDANGAEIDHFYVSAYDACVVSNTLRSLSGKAPANTITGSDLIADALRKNSNSNYENGGWYIQQWCDRALINDLLVLIGKSTNTQETFGYGHYTGGTSASSLLNSGTMNDKGLFWGKSASGYGVKVFGIENYWGNLWKWCGGLMASGNAVYAKMTWDTTDGSAGRGYGTTAVSTMKNMGKTLGGTSGGYISNTYNSDFGNIPVTANGSSETYECDGLWFTSSSGVYLAHVGGSCNDVLRVGAFCVVLNTAVSGSDWSIGASISCKPLAS